MTVLETARLQLRQMTVDDVDALHAVLSDPVAMKHYPKPFDLEMTRGWVDWNLQYYRARGFGLWAMVDRADGRVIGDCGLTIQHVDGVDEIEIGYHLLRSRWGHGFATEAAIACRDYVFDQLGRDRVISWMGAENTPSRRVAERVGMTFETTATNRFGNVQVVYAMSRADRTPRVGS